MDFLFAYFLKVNLGMLMMTAAYLMLLRKEKYFNLNRVFLLSALLLPLVLPVLPGIRWLNEAAWPPELKPTHFSEYVSGGREMSGLPSGHSGFEEPGISWLPVLFAGYALVCLALLLRFTLRLRQIFKIIRSGDKSLYSGYTLCAHGEDLPPFSFIKWMVINPALYAPETLHEITAHEKAHIAGRHSFDILLADLFQLFFWINPAVAILKRNIMLNLEYAADRAVLKTCPDRKHYQFSLLKQILGGSQSSVVNAFHSSKIKRRIFMMNSTRSTRRNLYRLLLTTPFIIAAYLAVSTAQAGVLKDYKTEESLWQTGMDGYYRLDQDTIQYLHIGHKSGKLILQQMWDGKEIEFEKKDELNYFNAEYNFPLVFSKNEAGVVNHVLAFGRDNWSKASNYHKPPEPKTAKLTEKQLQRYAGTYQMDGHDEQLQFVAKAPGLVVTELWRNNSFPILPSSEKIFFGKTSKYPVEFSFDAGGKVTQALIFGHDVWKKIN